MLAGTCSYLLPKARLRPTRAWSMWNVCITVKSPLREPPPTYLPLTESPLSKVALEQTKSNLLQSHHLTVTPNKVRQFNKVSPWVVTLNIWKNWKKSGENFWRNWKQTVVGPGLCRTTVVTKDVMMCFVAWCSILVAMRTLLKWICYL